MVAVLLKILNENGKAPVYKHDYDAGADIMSAEEATIMPNETKIVGTGFAIGLPKGWEAQIRSRSGLAAKNSVFCLNSPGTIDFGYFDEVKIILRNEGSKPFHISVGDRIAQMVIAPVNKASFAYVDNFNSLGDVDRGGGLGSTGVK